MRLESKVGGENSRPRVDRLFFLGSPLIDITAKVDDDFLRKYGLRADNAYVVDENNRRIFDEIRPTSVQIGGSVTNTARVVNKKVPKRVTFLGTVGDDEYGNFFKKELEKEGLGDFINEIGGSTGKVAVLLKGKGRTLVTDLGASRIFSLSDKIWQQIHDNSVIYVSGFFISVSYSTICQLIESQKTIVFNLGAPFLTTKFPKEMTYIYRNSSLIFGNESEHRAFAKIHDITSNSLANVIQETNQILDNKSRVVVVTRGSDSVVVSQDSHWMEFEVRDLEEDRVVDTNGAGDAFAGGFLARYIEGDSVANCVFGGIEAACEIIQRVGFKLD